MGIDWKAVREEFGSGSVTITELARKHGLHRNTIGKRIKKECWRRKNGLDDKNFPAAVSDRTTELIDDHRVLWKGVKKRLVNGLQNSDVKLGLEELKVAKIAGEVLSSVIKGERQAWGIEQEACETIDDTQKIAAEMERATVPCGADEAVD